MDLFSKLTELLRSRAPGLELREQEPMRNHTSFRIGGPVRLMALPKSAQEAVCAVTTAAQMGIVPVFMGNGSNLLVCDEGLEAFVLKAAPSLKESQGLGGIVREGDVLHAGSGVLLSRLATFALEEGLSGLEFAHGIPGSLGGAVTMNAGAYGGEMKDVVLRTEFLTQEGERHILEGAAHDFAYRHSTFSDASHFLLGATLQLRPGEREEIAGRMAELSEKRRSKQPLEYPSAGSTFKRPEGYFAAALIEECGLKGYTSGGAQVSEKHAGFVINRGGATCGDVLRVVDHVRETVLRCTGVALEPEVRGLGISF